MIEALNPVIRGWGNYYRKANVRTLFHRLDGWIERRLLSFIAQRWRNTAWRHYPTCRLVNEFGLVRLMGEAPRSGAQEVEAVMAMAEPESLALTNHLMEAICAS